jgi:hypothetical protein
MGFIVFRLAPFDLRLTIEDTVWAIGDVGEIRLDWGIFDIFIPQSAFPIPHLEGSRIIEM